MAEYPVQCFRMAMEVNNDSTEKKDIAVRATVYLKESKNGEPKALQNQSSMMAKVVHIGDCKKDAAFCKELSGKLKQSIEEYATNSEEKTQLLHKVIDRINQEKHKRIMREVIALNRRCSILKKVWANRELPVDRKSLCSVASKDAFDMTSLNESLPLKPGEDTGNKAEILSKKFLSLVDQKRLAIRRSEIAKLLDDNTHEMNNNLPSSLSKVCQPPSLTNILKKVCCDLKNVHIFALKTLQSAQSQINGVKVSSPKLQALHLSHGDKMQHFNGTNESATEPSQTNKDSFEFGKEMDTFSQCIKMEEAKNVYQKEENKLTSGNNFQIAKPFQFAIVSHPGHDEKHNYTAQQQMHDSVALGRQLSRLKITNSKRSDVTESMNEYEITETSDKSKNDQAIITEDRKKVAKQRSRDNYWKIHLKRSITE